MLTKDGCPYSLEERPKGGVNLIPYIDGCFPYEDPLKIVKGFEKYQSILSKMVKRLTGKTVEQKLIEDIENYMKIPKKSEQKTHNPLLLKFESGEVVDFRKEKEYDSKDTI